MEKIAIIGDIHFSRKAENPIIKKYIKDGQAKFFDDLVVNLKASGIKTVLMTGDIHDTRVIIDVEAMVNTKRLLQDKMKDFDIHIILGNHDMYYENSYDISALELFEDIPNVTVYRQNVVQKELLGKTWYFIPWIIQDKEEKFVEFLQKMATKPQEKRDNTVLFGHFDMFGVDMEGNGNLSSVGLDPNLFLKAAKTTFSGHYHGKSQVNKMGSEICYVGSPYPMTFANADSKHGYWILDEEGNKEFIENTISPTFKDIWDTDNLDDVDDLTNSFVRFYMSNSLSMEQIFDLRLKIESKNPLLIKKIPYDGGEKNDEEKREIQEQANNLLGKSTVKLAEMYIDQHEDELPKLKLTTDSRKAILDRIEEYKAELNLN